LIPVNYNSLSSSTNHLKTIASLLILFLLVSPFADFVTVFSRHHEIAMGSRFSLLFRLFILAALVVLCVIDDTRDRKLLWMVFGGGVLVHLLFMIANTDENLSLYLEGVLTLVKFHLFFLYLAAIKITMNLGMSYEKILKTFYVMIAFYAVTIIAGAIFNIEMFHYYSTERWGVKGVIIAGNEVSGLLVAALGILLINDRTRSNILLIILVALAMVLCGTKAALLGLVMIMTAHYLSSGGLASVAKLAVVFLTVLVICGMIYSNNLAVQEAILNSVAYFEYQFDNYANGSVFTLLLSGRDLKLDVVVNDIINTNIIHFFVGGYPISGYMIEMDLFDYIALSGVIGAAVYFYFWIAEWKGMQGGYKKRFTYSFLLTFIALGFMGGHMFYSAVAAPFLAFMVLSLKEDSKSKCRNIS